MLEIRAGLLPLVLAVAALVLATHRALPFSAREAGGTTISFSGGSPFGIDHATCGRIDGQ
jgi:hypothetical protein